MGKAHPSGVFIWNVLLRAGEEISGFFAPYFNCQIMSCCEAGRQISLGKCSGYWVHQFLASVYQVEHDLALESLGSHTTPGQINYLANFPGVMSVWPVGTAQHQKKHAPNKKISCLGSLGIGFMFPWAG